MILAPTQQGWHVFPALLWVLEVLNAPSMVQRHALSWKGLQRKHCVFGSALFCFLFLLFSPPPYPRTYLPTGKSFPGKRGPGPGTNRSGTQLYMYLHVTTL